MKVNCKNCNQEFDKNKNQIKRTKNNFCCRSCAASYNNRTYPKKTKINRICENCKTSIAGKGKKYCSITCQAKFYQETKIQNWQNGKDSGYETNGTVRRYIKKYLIQKSDYKCSKCGWNEINPTTKKCPLEIHHIDGNYKNNVEENLQVLCPNCHSLTNTYKNMNKGNGRRCRK